MSVLVTCVSLFLCSVAQATPYSEAVAPVPGGAKTASDIKWGGGFDPKQVSLHGFGAARATVKSMGKGCVNGIKNMLCKESMWAGLGLQERVQRLTKISMKQAPSRGVDFRAMPCITRRESIWFDPSIMTFMTCSIPTTDQGLGQAVFTTFKDLVEHYHFKSKVAPFDQPPYTNDPQLLFEAMALSAELQLEVTAEILRVKLQVAKGDYQKAFAFYNGSKDKEAYGQAVGACYQCVKQKMDSSMAADQQIHTNIDECLNFAMAGNGVDYSFSKFSHECRGDGDSWKGPYFLKNGVKREDLPCKGIDPSTLLPFPADSRESLNAAATCAAKNASAQSHAGAAKAKGAQ